MSGEDPDDRHPLDKILHPRQRRALGQKRVHPPSEMKVLGG